MHQQSRLSTISFWFSQMSETLQAVALVTLFRRTTPKISKFLAIILESALSDETELEASIMEANNLATVRSIRALEQEGAAMSKILTCLPLLDPHNVEAKNEYLNISKLLLNNAVSTGFFLEEAKELMTILILHPAFKPEKKSFENYNRALVEKCQKDLVENATSFPVGKINAKQRSNSLTPPYSEHFSQDCDYARKVRSSSISLYGGPLSPQSSGTTSSGSGSETHLENMHLISPNAIANDPVLRNDVEAWLKYLRLHKYTEIFLRMSYEQLISINESNFEEILLSLGYERITEGARRKIILHISKLGERVQVLSKKDEEVTSGESLVLKAAIDELKIIVNTPIRSTCLVPHNEANIPSLYCSVLNKVCTYTLTSSNCNAQAILCDQLIPLLDITLEKPAFMHQKKKIMEWKSQITQLNARVQSKHFLHAPQRPKIHRNSLTLSPTLNVETLQLPKKHSLQDHIPLIAQRPPSAPPAQSGIDSLDRLESLAIKVAEKPLSPE
ncbi:protein Smaug homolog 1 [Bemisia tabaci]|nr:PREDICTED: protein Smaug homolog 1 [Bemisia tabaci]